MIYSDKTKQVLEDLSFQGQMADIATISRVTSRANME